MSSVHRLRKRRQRCSVHRTVNRTSETSTARGMSLTSIPHTYIAHLLQYPSHDMYACVCGQELQGHSRGERARGTFVETSRTFPNRLRGLPRSCGRHPGHTSHPVHSHPLPSYPSYVFMRHASHICMNAPLTDVYLRLVTTTSPPLPRDSLTARMGACKIPSSRNTHPHPSTHLHI